MLILLVVGLVALFLGVSFLAAFLAWVFLLGKKPLTFGSAPLIFTIAANDQIYLADSDGFARC